MRKSCTVGKAVCTLFLLACFVLPGFGAEKDTAAATRDTAARTDATRKMRRIERFVYGQEKPGSLAVRLEGLSKDLLGRDTAHEEGEKLDSLYRFLFAGSEKAPSLETKVNFLEWKIFHEVRQGKVGDRLTSLEKIVFSEPSAEPLAFRVEQLVHMSVEHGIIALMKVKIAKGTPIRVKLEKTLSSKKTREGDGFFVSVLDDVILERNILAIAKGGYAYGEVDQVRRSRRFGRSGLIRMRVNDVGAIDSTMVPVSIDGPKEQFDKKKIGMAVGASAIGYIALGGPVGLVGGIFVKGRDAEIPAGTELTVLTLQDTYVSGIVINRP